ncbi:hypothetical protein FHG87_012511 [Trinorchestia longiramus]|nr:hypothetical protein FHG87_012511 [Trinorchestia longiramus]
MDSNRFRYKQVGSKFRSTEDSRVLRAITQEDDRRVKRSNVVHVHRNIPETLSPEPSPLICGIRSTKKALAAAAAVGKAKARIEKLSKDSNEDDKQTASPMNAGHHGNREINSSVLKNSNVKNHPSASMRKTTKSSKLIGEKTLEEQRKERMERLKLYKQFKQRKREREKAAKKPNFWLGVAKKETKMLLLPAAPPEPKPGRKLETPSKAQAPIWHSGFSSVSKKRQAPGNPAPISTNKPRVQKNSRSLFRNISSGATSSSKAVTKQLPVAAPCTGKLAKASLEGERFRPAGNISFAPMDYKFSAPSGLQRVPSRPPTPRRPSIRFSRTPPRVTPSSSGQRRMPRTKTPRPNTHSAHRPSSSSASTESSSSSDELPAGNSSIASEAEEIPEGKISSKGFSERSSSGSPMNPEIGSDEGKKLSRRPSKRRSSQLSNNEENVEVPGRGCFNRASSSTQEMLEDQNSKGWLEARNVPEEQLSAENCTKKLVPKSKVKKTKGKSLSSSGEEQICSDVEVVREKSAVVTPPNTEFSFAVLADSIKKKSRERSVSKVSRSSSIKKFNLISKLNLSANEANDGGLDVKSPSIPAAEVYGSSGKKSPSVRPRPLAENLSSLGVQQHSSTSSLSEEKDFHLHSNSTLVSVSSSSCLSASPVSNLLDHHTASIPKARSRPNSSSKKAQDRRPSGHKSSSSKKRSESLVLLTVPVPDESGCSPELQSRGKSRKSVLKIISPTDTRVDNSSVAPYCAPSTPAPSSVRQRRSMSVRRSTRIASMPSNAGEDELRTPNHVSQRMTATTPCSRTTRRSLAVHAASTWEEFCETTPHPSGRAKTPRRQRKTVTSPVRGEGLSSTDGSQSPRSENMEEPKLGSGKESVDAKTPGRRGRRKTVISGALNDIVPELDKLREIENETGPQSEGDVTGTADASVVAANVVQQPNTSLLVQGNASPIITPRLGSREKKRKLSSSCVTPVNISISATHKSSERPRKKISATPAISVHDASSSTGSSLVSSSPPSPIFSSRKKEILSLSCGRQAGQSSCSNSRRKIRPSIQLTRSVGVLRLRSLRLSSDGSSPSLSERRSPLQQSGSSLSLVSKARSKTSVLKQLSSIVMMYPSCSSSGASPSLSPGSSRRDVSELLDESPFVNTESRALKRRKLARKESSFMSGVCEDTLHSLPYGHEEETEVVTPAVDDLTNADFAELLRPTTPRSPADVSINVWDEISSPARDTDGGPEVVPSEQGNEEAKENQDPGSGSSSVKRRSLKPKRRSSLREGALLGALKARTESSLNSRVSLGLFAKGAPESPDVPAGVADGDDLISWESPKPAPQKQNAVVDQSSVESPKPRFGSVRGRRVSRLAALYEHTAVTSAHSPDAAAGAGDTPASIRRSKRLSHLTPV